MASSIANSLVGAIVRSRLHRLLGASFAVIEVTGVKSGKTYATPVNIAPTQGGYTVVSSRERTWWRNLRGGRRARLTAAGSTFPVTGRVIEAPEEVADGLADYLRRYPAHAKFFGVAPGPEGRPLKADLDRAAAQRVLVRLSPSDAHGGTSGTG